MEFDTRNSRTFAAGQKIQKFISQHYAMEKINFTEKINLVRKNTKYEIERKTPIRLPNQKRDKLRIINMARDRSQLFRKTRNITPTIRI